jgi:hypothetical protein
MLSSLESSYAFVTTTPRRRLSSEGPAELLRAYIDLLFAWGYAQRASGEPRARELLAASTEALPANDPIHAAVLHFFRQRIREKSASPWTPLDLSFPLDSSARYKVHRLFEVSAILSRIERWSPIHSQFDRGAIPPDDPLCDVLRADGEGRVEAVREGLQRAFDLLATATHFSGVSLIGPSARAGCSDLLRGVLRRRFDAEPQMKVAAGLTAMGERVDLVQFELLNSALAPRPRGDSHPERELAAGRMMVGALAISGRTSEASDWFARLWPNATDGLSTNTHFCRAAVSLCEVAVLSALRHELALGNRTTLDLGSVKEALQVTGTSFRNADGSPPN